METKSEPRKASKKKDKVKEEERPVLNDIIKKIVDVHATVDQALAEMSHSCQSQKDCEGK